MMKDNFCAFILTHGRPDNVITYNTLINQGYTGKVYIVIDDEDSTADRYYENFGDKVLMFSKEDISKKFDQGDNFNDRRCIIYARNACFELAEQVNCKHFIQLDDDYTSFHYRPYAAEGIKSIKVKSLDAVFQIMLDLFLSTDTLTLAIAQGGDYMGAKSGDKHIQQGFKRKAMNSFICSTDRPFKFYGRINEDVNFYTCEGRRGALIYTIFGLMLNQKTTQASEGGMTDIYLDKGTYFKSFYSIMYSPSCVKIALMGTTKDTMRLHHKVNWNNTSPQILDEIIKKLN